MKTFLKRFGFLAILAIMFNVEVVGQPTENGIYAIVNDEYVPVNNATQFRDEKISAIAGEEINFVYYDTVENNTISVIWKIDGLDSDTTNFYTYMFLHADSCGSAAPLLYIYNQVDGGQIGDQFRIYTKFSPSELSVINSDSDESTKSGSNFLVGDSLFMNDFEIILAVPGSGVTDTRLKDTITNISWYSATNDSLLYESINTNDFYLTTQPGEYYIKLEVKYSILSTDYFRYIFSDTITVNSIIIANDDEFHYLNEGDVFNVFVNDLLNGNPVNFEDVTLIVIESNEYLILNYDGMVNVAPGTPVGTHTLSYQICETSNLTNCDDATVTIIVEDNPTEINLLSSNEKLTVYPNPTADVLNISEEVKYSVYSYSGQEILRGFGKEIDVAKLSVGTYILKTDKGDNKFTVVR